MAADDEDALARGAVYAFLAAAFLYPAAGSAAWLGDGARQLNRVAADADWQDVADIAHALERELGAGDDASFERAHVDVFGHTVATACPPYEGEYGQDQVFQKSQTLADLSAFYHAFGVRPHPELKDRLDHVSVELDFMHLLTLKESYARLQQHGEDKVALCRQAQERFLARHLAPWILVFARRLGQTAAPGSLYASLAELLTVHMQRELTVFRLTAPLWHEVAPPDQAGGEDDTCDACPFVSSMLMEGQRS